MTSCNDPLSANIPAKLEEIESCHRQVIARRKSFEFTYFGSFLRLEMSWQIFNRGPAAPPSSVAPQTSCCASSVPRISVRTSAIAFSNLSNLFTGLELPTTPSKACELNICHRQTWELVPSSSKPPAYPHTSYNTCRNCGSASPALHSNYAGT